MRRLVPLTLLAIFVLGVSVPAYAGGRPLTADLSFENEIPAADSTATGSAEFTLNQGQGEICFNISVTGLSGAVTADHIHMGAADQNGGVVVSLEGDLNGCVDADRAMIKAIRQNPGNYYVNVHTSLNPGGEVRGQLSK